MNDATLRRLLKLSNLSFFIQHCTFDELQKYRDKIISIVLCG